MMPKKKDILEMMCIAQSEIELLYKRHSIAPNQDLMKRMDKMINSLSAEKKEKKVDECYPEFVKIWTEYNKELGFDALSGSKMKSIIQKTKRYLLNGNRGTSKEEVCNMWQYIVKYLSKGQSWYSGKGLPVIESRFFELVNEIKNGRTKPIQSRSDQAIDFIQNLRASH